MRKDILLIPLGFAVVALVAIAIVTYATCGQKVACFELSQISDCLFDFYAKNLRGSLFAGFLTLGGFLMSLTTFIVVNMKKEVFDKDQYERQWKSSLANNKKTDQMRYGPLRYLSTTLFVSIVACISTATLQLTLGLVSSGWSVLVCVWAAAVAIAFILRSLTLIKQNLNSMFDFLDEEQRKKNL